MKRVIFLTIASVAFQICRAQHTLLRPAIASGIGYESRAFVNIQVAGDVKAVSLNLTAQILAKNGLQYLFAISPGTSWDTTNLQRGSFSSQTYEMGIGRWFENGKFFSQSAVTVGHQYTKYRFYDANQQINYFSNWCLASTIQLAAGINLDVFEIGVTGRVCGLYALKNNGNPNTMNDQMIGIWQKSKELKQYVAVEPGIFMSICIDDYTALTFQLKAPMLRDEFSYFTMPKASDMAYSIGLKFF